jgi:hypothetical protein
MEFNAATLEMIQGMAYPLIKSLTGFDAQAYVGEKSEVLTKVGEGFAELSELFLVAGAALSDGILSADEFEAIVTEAKDIPAALAVVKGFFDTPEVAEPVE